MMTDDIEMGDEATAPASPRSRHAGSRSPRPSTANAHAVAPSSPSATPLRRPGEPPSPKSHQSHVAHPHPYHVSASPSPAFALTSPTPAPSPAQLASSRDLGRGQRSVSLSIDTRPRQPPRRKMRTASTPQPIGLGLRGTPLDILESRMEEVEEGDSSGDEYRRRRTPQGSTSSNSIATTPTTPLSPISGRSDTGSLNPSPVLPSRAGGSSSALESGTSSLSVSMSGSQGSGSGASMSTASSASITSTTPATPTYTAYAAPGSAPAADRATSNDGPSHPEMELCSDPDCIDCVPYNLTNALEREVALRQQLEIELEKERRAREETEARAASLLDEAEHHKRISHKLHTQCEAMSQKISGERGYTENLSDKLLSQLQEFQEEISRHRKALGMPPMGDNYLNKYGPQLDAAKEAYVRAGGRPRSPVSGNSSANGWGAPSAPPAQG